MAAFWIITLRTAPAGSSIKQDDKGGGKRFPVLHAVQPRTFNVRSLRLQTASPSMGSPCHIGPGTLLEIAEADPLLPICPGPLARNSAALRSPEISLFGILGAL